MSYEINLRRALDELRRAIGLVQKELQEYPTPVSGGDAQYNHLIGQRNLIDNAIQSLATPRFVATPYIHEDSKHAERG